MVADHQGGGHQAGIGWLQDFRCRLGVVMRRVKRWRKTRMAMTVKFSRLNPTPAANAGA